MSRLNHKRGEDPVAGEILSKIPALKSVLAHSSKIALDKTKGDSAGFMFLSRYNKGVDESPKIREKAHKVANAEEEGEEVERGIQPKATEPTANTGNNYEKKKRYALSLATLASKPSKRLTIVNEGAITVLIELSAIYDKAIQVRCASAFASLSVESKIRARMLDEGALASIISLATNSNIREVKTDCARAICNLCCEKGYEFKMVKEGVPYVVTHVASTCPDTFEICIKILMNITCVTDKFARIEDITEALMFFINSNFTLTYEQELLLLISFRNLASLKNNQLRLVEDGCLKIVDRFFQSSHSKFRKISCEILKYITMDWKTHSKLLEQNILNILLLMYHDRDEEIKILCIKSFLYLSEDENFRKQIVNGIAIKHLLNITIIKQSKLDIYQIIAKTLRLLCADYNLAYKLVENGISNTLITLIRCDNHLIHQYCAEALCGLFQTTEILDILIQQGAAQELIKLTYQTNNPHSCEWCSFALYQLSKGNINCNTNEISKQFYESILPCIIYLCELDYSTDITKRFCSAAFAHATLSKSINCSNAIPLLVKMLRNENNQIIKKYCASSLFNLADNNENCYKMLDSQALLPVVELTQNPYHNTSINSNSVSSTSTSTTGDNGNDPKVICAGIISRLSLHKSYYDQFLNGNVLKVLLELSSVDHRLTQRRVVIALSNLSQNEELKLKLLDLNPIPYIISLASERDEYLRRGCISIVCNMSYLPGSEKAIVQAGIIPTLMITSLITSDQITSKIICVKALTNLMADRSQIKSMVKDGIIWGLSKLAQLDNIEMLNLCAKALRVLSYNFSREMLNSQVAIRTLLRFINTNDINLMLSGAHILTNILLKTNNLDEEFHKLIVDNIITLAKSNNKELNKLCVICLCLASQSESCRTGIVSSGMLQMIDSNTIFSDPIVSYAYITMFGNIANNPNMRSKVFDEHLIERFERICDSNMLHLQIAVAKALYCLSCSQENIPKLINQNIIPMIKTMSEFTKNTATTNNTTTGTTTSTNNNAPNMELLSHLIACLYNLTIVIDIQHQLVSQGFVQVLQNLWLDVIKDKDLCLLCYLSICHLACGKTNTTQMVNDNCTNILCFISEYRKNNLYRNYNFTVDIHYRCSAALRNLLSVVSNQSMMVEQGCLDTIIYLANFSTKDRNQIYNPNDPSSGNFRGIWRNCSVALNSLTYNHDIREKLVQSEAINIILRNAEVDNGDISLGQGLMKELEAESWDNGARGRHKEGRSKLVKPSKLYTELLRGGSTVQLDFSIEDEKLEKYCVQVQLDEPELVSTDTAGVVVTTTGTAAVVGVDGVGVVDGTTTATTAATTTIGGECPDETDITALNEVEAAHAAHLRYQAIAAAHSAVPIGSSTGDPQLRLHDPKGLNIVDKELSIEVLHPYEDNHEEDSVTNTNTYTFEKQECNMETETITLFRIDDNVEEATSINSEELPQESSTTSFPIPNGNIPGKLTTLSQTSFKLYDHNTMNSSSIVATDSSIETKKSVLPNLGSNAIASMFYKASTSPNSIPPAVNKHNNTNNTMFPPLIDSNQQQQQIIKQKRDKFNRSLTKNVVKATPKQEEFQNIVSMIKEAKSGKSASIDDVVNKWKEVSRF